MRGYFGIGIYQGKTVENLGMLWRSAYSFNAAFLFTVAGRYTRQAADTVDATKHIPLYQYADWDMFVQTIPFGCLLVGVEQTEGSLSLESYSHHDRAVYVLGAEDNGLPANVIESCNLVVHITSMRCLNVAVAGSIIMYDRQAKRMRL